MEATKEAAEAFVKSYDEAMQSGTKPGVSLETCARNLASHNSPDVISFQFGMTINVGDNEKAAQRLIRHLESLEKADLGYDMFVAKHEVQVVADGSALCSITWEIRPKKESGMVGWQWLCVYGYRKAAGEEGKGHWEFMVSDNELGELLKRRPDFMELAGHTVFTG